MRVDGRLFHLRGSRSGERIARFGTPGRPRVVLAPDPAFSEPWGAARALLGALVALRGADRVEGALAPHRGPLSLVLRGLRPDLSADERSAAARAAARVPGYLSHNSHTRRHLARAWQDTLAPLCADLDLVVPDLLALDVTSAGLLPALLRTQPSLRVALGWDPDQLPDDPVRRWEARLLLATGDRLAALEGAQEPGPTGEGPPAAPHARHAADLAEEARTWGALRAGRADPSRVLEAMELAFACFGFTACQQLAQAASDPPPGPERRRTHRLLALSAYNRQVGTRGESAEADRALAEMLDTSFRAALDGEADPGARSHLLYRLCINSGRRQADLLGALPLAEEAVRVAAAAGLRMEEAWARNGLAYLLGRLRRTDDAIAECERAAALLEAPLPAPEEDDRAFSRAVLHDNLVELCNAAGRAEEAERWATCDEALPSARTLVALRRALRPGELRRVAEEAMARAEDHLDPLQADFFGVAAADAAYRQGDADHAARLLVRCAATNRRAHDDDAAWEADVGLAMSLLRAGRGAEAAARLATLAESAPDDGTRSELTATRGWALAAAGDVTGSEAAVNAAIGAAVALGNRDRLSRVACAAGEACLALGREADAEAAFRQALAIAGQGEGAAPADLLWALGGLLAAAGPDDALLDRALSLLEPALVEPEPWWELPRIRDAAVALGRPLEGLAARVVAERVGAGRERGHAGRQDRREERSAPRRDPAASE